MAKKSTTPKPVAVACRDFNGRTCINLSSIDGLTRYIPLNIETGLEVISTSTNEFDQVYKPMVDYPIEKACQLYLAYSQNIGASKDALEHLGRIINVNQQEFDMALSKYRTPSTIVEKPVKAGRRATDPVVKTPAKEASSKPVKPVKQEKLNSLPKSGEKKVSAAQRFQELIMQGKLTDDQIFDKVKAEFNLEEKKRGYVKWYRNHLKKQGQNPPEPK